MRMGGTKMSRIREILLRRIRFTKGPASRWLTLLAPLVFIGGCSGLVSQTSQQVPPPATFSLSGTITPAAGGNGATVTLSGAASGSTTANSSGAFTFSGLKNGTYTLTPSRTGYTFSPTSQNVTVNGATVTGVSFTATQQVTPTYSISGTISPVAGGNGAAVTLSGAASASTTANTSGNYTFSGLANGTYTVTPSLVGYTYSPASQNATVNGANVSGVNFAASVVAVAPTITTQPSNQTVTAGQTATFTVVAAGTAPLSYQWQKNTVNIAGAIASSYTTPATATTDSGSTFAVVVSNTAGKMTSTGATLTVNPATVAPSITSLNPTSGLVGSPVTISGANFGATQGTSTVKFNGTAATATSWSASSIGVTVPAGATTGNVVVTVGGAASNGVSFTVTAPAPSITSLNPASGLAGSPVTISGANFGTTQGTSTVQFNGTAATPTSWSATSIGVTVPAGATTGNVVVTVGGAASNGVTFAVTAAGPNITSLNPTSGLVGSAVTISGANFGATQGTSTVKFNGTAAAATSWSTTSIGVTVPAGATTGNVVVTVGGVASNGVSFTVTTPAPSLTSLNPASGLVGSPITISGANFGATQGTSTVKFNGIAATPTSWSATSIVATVPAGATTGNVVVTVGGVASNGVSFTVTTAAPSITSLNPTSGLVSSPVTISGANFGATQGTSTVKFNGTAATPTSWSATSIVAAVPAGATTGNVVVTVGGAASNGVSFTVTAPTPSITSLNPTSGVLGTVVTISGANFGATQGTSAVSFNGTTATPTSWSATSIAVPVPAGATTGNVVVTVGGAASNGVSFTITTAAPSITSLNPASGLVGSPVTISGANFGATQGTSTVQFNGTAATPTSWSATSIGVTVPTGATTGNVVVTVGGVASNGVSFTVSSSTSAVPTLIYSTAVPLAVPSGSAWGGASPCGQNVVCYRIPLPEPTIAGTTLVMAFGYDSTGSNQVFSVTDNKSNTWVLDVTSAASNNKTMRMYRASNVAAGTTAINVQLNSGSQNGYWNALIGEFYNVGALDGSSCSAGSSATISAGNISPAQSGDLIFQAKYSAGLSKQTSSFTQGLQSNITWSLASQLLGDGAADQYGVYSSTVPMNPTFTQAASDSYISCAVALTAASSGAAATAIPRVVHQEHDAMPKNAANPWHVGLVVDVPNAAVYLSYVGNDSISSVSSVPAPNVGWTPSGVDFQGLNGHNHVNYYCAQWTTPPGGVTLSINRSGSSNDSINMIYVVQNGTCNLDVDSGGQAGSQGSSGPLTTCTNCLTPTKPNDFIMGNGGQAFCTATGLNSPSGGTFDSAWFTGNTIDGPTQTDENNFWMHFTNGSSLSPFTVTFAESCDFSQSDWAGRLAAYQTN